LFAELAVNDLCVIELTCEDVFTALVLVLAIEASVSMSTSGYTLATSSLS
jgi:hypothetical protein